ncbi:hypothetical protein KM1_072270 [Entamoeba histolytica HM-3:IMSS]|uniref:Uncharacterized protein n=3 Tax=Entamoeba histolytica TaxID=5759 RepID=M2RYQ6_ENTHI|nr:Hypothetical protein EHI5A_024740 [Entamoeba histolytica KU27]EMS12468.1 hypothetical protein KM1_072270 [Entamoeba histolytica HM-3:IMSS]ENY60351.1 hypothetical protein EHI7A_050360 [Entamoeba histolytica HM-1:IMSS-A]
MNYIFNSQNSQLSQPLFSQLSQNTSSQNTTQITATVRPSLLLARNQLEQKHKEKEERKRIKKELLKATLNQTIQMAKELKKRRKALEKLQTICQSIGEEMVLSYNEQSSLLMKFFDELQLTIDKATDIPK